MSARLCLFGAGGHGRVVAAQVRARQPRTEICFGDGRRPVGSSVNGYPVEFDTPDAIRDARLIVTIGDNALRARLQQAAVDAGVDMASFVADPDRYFAAAPGAGSMVLAGALVTGDARIGAGVLVNSGAIVEHDSDVGDFCHLAPGSVLAGGSILGEGVFVGAGARVVNEARIAAGVLIGAGATVIGDISRPGVYGGTPARLIGPLPARQKG